jgi:hypothetical protein
MVMVQMGPMRVAGQAKAALGAPPMPPPFSPTFLVEGRVPPPSTYINGPLGGEFDMCELRELLGRALLSPSCTTPLLSLSVSLSHVAP